jgi:hypothetical protein
MPEIGEIRKASEIGKLGWAKFTWLPCETCGAPRWVRILKGQPECRDCNICGTKKMHQSRHVERTCIQCGNDFDITGAKLRKGTGQFCSVPCLNAYQKEHPFHTGENSPHWKGGYVGKYYDAMRHTNQRAAYFGAPGTITYQEVKLILEDAKCRYCGSSEPVELDHVIPLSKKGPNTKDNVVPCCDHCNSAKRDRLLTPKDGDKIESILRGDK